MAQCSRVPKFGDWEHNDNVPYTLVFEKARSDKRGVKPNPSDLRDISKPKTPGNTSQEIVRLRKPSDSPLHQDTLSAGHTPKRATRQSQRVGSDRSIERSPLHPQSQARLGGKVAEVASPSRERKGFSGGSLGLNPSTPERSRLRSVGRRGETPDHGTVVPKFGDWNDNDPGASEGYTNIFSKLREEKLTGDRNMSFIPSQTSFTSAQKQDKNVNLKNCGCIPWGRS